MSKKNLENEEVFMPFDICFSRNMGRCEDNARP